MKKIKSVKLKNDFRTSIDFIPKGIRLELTKGGYYYIPETSFCYPNKEIESCTTDLFEIEYEPERKSITVKIEYENVGDSNLTFTVEKITTLIGSFLQIKNLKVTEVKND